MIKNYFFGTQAYFDCNATTPVLPIAAEAALNAMRILYGNPSSSHLSGLQAKSILESTRKIASQAIGSEPEQIIFTSGATEAIQTAIFSVLQSYKGKVITLHSKLLYGATEHKAVPQALHHWVKALDLPFEVYELPVDSLGQIKLKVLQEHLPLAALVCTMAVNNETGVIQKLSAIEEVLIQSQSKALWLVDCVQALGKLELNLNCSRINYAPFSGHKLYAPKGIGFLYVKKDSPFTPLIVGGGQEKGQRSGTENLPGVAALGEVLNALKYPAESLLFHPKHQLTAFKEKIILELKRAFPKVEFNTPFEQSVATTINFSVPGFSSAELLDLFDSGGLRVSAGSACTASSARTSHVLDAMGIPKWRSISAIRLSFGPCTTEREIDRGCKIIRQSALALRNTCLLETASVFEAPENLRDGIIQFRAGSTNSWILAHREARTCIIIDPCETVAERMEHYVRCQNLEILAILDTHSHGDHESIRPALYKILQDKIRISSKTQLSPLGWPKNSTEMLIEVELDNKIKVPAIRINPNTFTEVLVIAQVPTPGHTDDSQAFLIGISKNNLLKKEDIHFAFCGDTILGGGLGRTNFSASDPELLFHSLRTIQTILSPNTLLCPAHDYTNSFATRLKTEIEENTLLSLALKPIKSDNLKLFLEKKEKIDLDLVRLEDGFQGIICGVTPTAKLSVEIEISISNSNLKQYLEKTNPFALVVDVREQQEYSLFKNWNSIGLKEAPRNVPLSRFVNFMSELLISKSVNQDIILICKTGTRSLQAAKALRRLGFNHVWNLEHGVALSGAI